MRTALMRGSSRDARPLPSLPELKPLDLIQVSAPFDDPDFLYEVKFDGFRALAYVEKGHCELVSGKGHTYTSGSRTLINPSGPMK